MRAPQIIVIILFTVEFAVATLKHGESKGNYNIVMTILDIATFAGLLIWSGFFTY